MKAAWLMVGWLAGAGYPALAMEVRFEGTGSPLPSNVVQVVHQELTRLVGAHRALFRRNPAPDFAITYHISLTREEYAGRLKATGNADKVMAGFTQTRQSWQVQPQRRLLAARCTIETWRQPRTNEFISILLHESAHAVTAAFVGTTPLWCTEGSAELLGSPAAGQFKTRNQVEATRWGTLARLIQEGKMPPLRKFLEAGSYAAWDEVFGRRDLAYTASYSLFFFFSAQPNAFRTLAAWLDSRDLQSNEDVNRAFADYLDRNWPGGLAAFERTWHAWILAQAARPPSPAARP